MSDQEPRPDWLPAGWTMDVRVRKNGRKDKYYINPVSAHVFRSVREVIRYLEAGDLGRGAFKQNEESCISMESEDIILSVRGMAKSEPKVEIKNEQTPEANSKEEIIVLVKNTSYQCKESMVTSTANLSENNGLAQEEKDYSSLSKFVSASKVGPCPEKLASENCLERNGNGELQHLRSKSSKKVLDLPCRSSKRLAGIKVDPPSELKNKLSEKVLDLPQHTSKRLDGIEVAPPSELKRKSSEVVLDMPRRTSKRLAGIEVAPPSELKSKSCEAVLDMPHGTSKRFTGIEVASPSELLSKSNKLVLDTPRRTSKRLAGIEVDPPLELKSKSSEVAVDIPCCTSRQLAGIEVGPPSKLKSRSGEVVLDTPHRTSKRLAGIEVAPALELKSKSSEVVRDTSHCTSKQLAGIEVALPSESKSKSNEVVPDVPRRTSKQPAGIKIDVPPEFKSKLSEEELDLPQSSKRLSGINVDPPPSEFKTRSCSCDDTPRQSGEVETRAAEKLVGLSYSEEHVKKIEAEEIGDKLITGTANLSETKGLMQEKDYSSMPMFVPASDVGLYPEKQPSENWLETNGNGEVQHLKGKLSKKGLDLPLRSSKRLAGIKLVPLSECKSKLTEEVPDLAYFTSERVAGMKLHPASELKRKLSEKVLDLSYQSSFAGIKVDVPSELKSKFSEEVLDLSCHTPKRLSGMKVNSNEVLDLLCQPSRQLSCIEVDTPSKLKSKLNEEVLALPHHMSERFNGIRVDPPRSELKIRSYCSEDTPRQSGELVTGTAENLVGSELKIRNCSSEDTPRRSAELETGSAENLVGLAYSEEHINKIEAEETVGDEMHPCSVVMTEETTSASDLQAGSAESSHKGTETTEPLTNFSMMNVDPCIEFAIKTLTGAIPIGADKINENPITLQNMSNENHQKLSHKNSGSPLALPPWFLLADPCIEFAVKTLTGEIPVEDCQGIQNYFQKQTASSKSHRQWQS